MNTICRECETVAHCTKHGCIPKVRDTIDMAREAGLNPDALAVQFLERFADLVRADERSVEREACAKCVEEKAKAYEDRAAQPKDVRDINPEVARIAVLACGQIAAAIRERSANEKARGVASKRGETK